MKYAPYSYSKIGLHDTCPRKFKYRYIDKLPREDSDKTALYKGICLHDMLEKYPEVSTNKLVPTYQHIFDDFLKSKYKVLLDIDSVRELGIGLSQDLEVLEHKSKLMFNGYVDYFAIINDVMILVDYKSGKYKEQKYQDYHQLMFYAIYMFQKYTKLEKIKLMYIYIEHDLDNSLILERKYLDNYKKALLNKIQNVEFSTFDKKPSKLCEWCDYEDYCSRDF